MSKYYKAALALSLATAAVVATMPTANAITFTDVESLGSASYQVELKQAIYTLANRGVVDGVGNNNFAPSKNITRAEAAKMIANARGLNTSTVSNPGFTDVSTKAWYYPYVAALANLQIINGYNNQFKPNDLITRGEMAKILVSAYSLKANTTAHPFKDIPTKHFSNEFVAILYADGITKGLDAANTKFGYADPVTRGQLAVFTVRAENYLNGGTTTEQPTTNPGTKVTLNAADYGFKSFSGTTTDKSNVYSASISSSAITLTALNEGQGKLLLKGTPSSSSSKSEAFYLVNVEKINGKLTVALEKADLLDYVDFTSQYYSYKDSGVGFEPAIATLKNSSGTVVNDLMSISLEDDGFDLAIYEQGKYTLTLESGKNTKTFTIDVTFNNFETKLDLN